VDQVDQVDQVDRFKPRTVFLAILAPVPSKKTLDATSAVPYYERHPLPPGCEGGVRFAP